MESEDRRVRKTKKALQEALMDLVKGKELSAVTVRTLVEKADVHRATFYMHYRDIYDLYEQIENTVLLELDRIIEAHQEKSYEELFVNIIEYIRTHTETCQFLLEENCVRGFRDRLCSFLERRYLDDWKRETGQNTVSDEWAFLAGYHAQGCLAIISRWASEGFIYPSNSLSDLILKICVSFDRIVM